MTLRSAQFDDIYFSAENGLEEKRHVFLRGNNLPELWNNKQRFVIAETGFGTGLNFLAAWTLFEKAVRRGLEQAGFSVEKKEGFGRKNEMLAARFSGKTPRASRPAAKRIAIVGGGLAGTAAASVLGRCGLVPVLFEKGPALAVGASG